MAENMGRLAETLLPKKILGRKNVADFSKG
jgi:hypothetical protein